MYMIFKTNKSQEVLYEVRNKYKFSQCSLQVSPQINLFWVTLISIENPGRFNLGFRQMKAKSRNRGRLSLRREILC